MSPARGGYVYAAMLVFRNNCKGSHWFYVETSLCFYSSGLLATGDMSLKSLLRCLSMLKFCGF